MARCHPQKNQERLFKTFDRLKEEKVEFHLLVLGAGYENGWMDKYKGDSQIHIIGERNNVADYMCFADFFVLTSDYEGLPLTLLEAMSLGVVPVCTPAGGIVDVIHDGVNGYLTKGFSDEEFYETVKKALMEKGRISRDRVMEDYRNHYSMKACVEKYYNAYLNAINRQKNKEYFQ